MTELLNLLKSIFTDLGLLLGLVFGWLLSWSLAIAWFAWWLWGVNWSKTWPVLRRGAWAGVVLFMLTSALVWSRIAPSECDCLGFMTVPNFWWQLGYVSLLTFLTFSCGWLQTALGWTPPEIDFDPPQPAVSHDHGHHH